MRYRAEFHHPSGLVDSCEATTLLTLRAKIKNRLGAGETIWLLAPGDTIRIIDTEEQKP